MPPCHTWPRNVRYEAVESAMEASSEAAHVHERTADPSRTTTESPARRPLEVGAVQTQLL